jgi:hypothetical protein
MVELPNRANVGFKVLGWAEIDASSEVREAVAGNEYMLERKGS